MIDQSNSFNLMAYCNLYIQSRDHYDLDKWSTHGLSIPHMPHHAHGWIFIKEHLGNDAANFNFFFLNISNDVPYILCTTLYHIKVKVKQTSRAKLKWNQK